MAEEDSSEAVLEVVEAWTEEEEEERKGGMQRTRKQLDLCKF